jgi:hypothetical protein
MMHSAPFHKYAEVYRYNHSAERPDLEGSEKEGTRLPNLLGGDVLGKPGVSPLFLHSVAVVVPFRVQRLTRLVGTLKHDSTCWHFIHYGVDNDT